MRKFDIDAHLQTIKDGDILTEGQFHVLCEKLKEILIQENNV